MIVAIVAQVVAADSFLNAADWTTISGEYLGKSTNYGGAYDGVAAGQASFGLSVGGCGFGDINDATRYPFRHAIAFDPVAKAVAGLPSFGCGSCWRITNTVNDKSVIAMVTDVCPGCNAKFGNDNHVDMHFDTWVLIADPTQVSSNGGGILDIKAERVSCQPEEDAQITIMDHQGTFSWFRMVPEKIAGYGTVKGVAVTCPDSITFGGKKETNPAKISKAMKNEYGCVYEIPEVPLYKERSSCYIEIESEIGEKLMAGPIELGKYVGRSVNKGVSAGSNFPPAALTAGRRKLVEGGPGNSSQVDLDDAGVTQTFTLPLRKMMTQR